MINILLNSLQYTCSSDYDTQVAKSFMDSTGGNISAFVKNGVLTIPCGVKSISTQVSSYNKKGDITDLQIPDTLTIIGNGSFRKLTGLTTVIIPDSIETIGHEAFMECSNLQYVRFGNNVTNLDYDIFRECTSLKTAILNSKITQLNSGLFWGCTSLKSINIPANVQYIDQCVFWYVRTMDCVSIQNKQAEINSYKNPFYYNQFDSKYDIIADFNDTCPTTDYVDCSYLQTDQTKYYFFTDEVKWCIEEQNVYFYIVNAPDNNNKYYVDKCPSDTPFYEQGVKPAQCTANCGAKIYYYDLVMDTHECISQCDGDYAKPANGSTACTKDCRFYKDPSKSYKECTSDENKCPTDYKYQLGQTGKECIPQCPYQKDPTYQYIKQTGQESNTLYFCIQTCEGKVWYTDGEQLKRCTKKESCTFDDDLELQDYNKQTSDQECVIECQYYWYKNQDSQNMCTQYNNCGDSNISPYFITQDNQCVAQCENSFFYQYSETKQKCTSEEDCQDAETSYVDADENPIYYLYRLGENSRECVKECTGTFVNAYYNISRYQTNFICSDKCRYYIPISNKPTFKMCTENNDTCPDNQPYEHYSDARQCISSCLSTQYVLVSTTPYKCSSGCGKTQAGDSYVYYQKDGVNMCTMEISCANLEEYKLTPAKKSTQCLKKCGTKKVGTQTQNYVWRDVDGVNQCMNVTYCNDNEFLLVDDYQCVEITSCPTDYIPVQDEDKQCKLNPCTVETNFYINQYSQSATNCVETCDKLWYSDSTTIKNKVKNYKVCLAKCPSEKQSLEQIEKQCVTLEQCQQQLHIIIADNKNQQCQYNKDITQCSEYSETKQYVKVADSNECKVNTCTGDKYYYDNEYNQNAIDCLSECPRVWFTDSQQHNICSQQQSCSQIAEYPYTSYNSNQCKDTCGYDSDMNSYVWYQDGDNKQCTIKTSCDNLFAGKQYTQFDNYECKENTCLDSNNFYDKVYNENEILCLKECSNVWFEVNNDDKYYKICTDKQLCSQTDYKFIKSTGNNQCIQQCDSSKVYYQQENNDLHCTQEESCEYLQDYKFIAATNRLLCLSECKENGEQQLWFKLTEVNANQCSKISSCQELNGNGMVYVEIENRECVENKCAKENVFYQSEYDESQYNCANSCNNVWYQFNKNGKTINVCTEYQNCQNINDYKYIRQDNQWQCLQSCGNDVWSNINGNYICRESQSCNENEYIIQDKKQCVQQCPTYYQGNTCVSQCSNGYYLQESTNVCSNTCTYYKPDNSDKTICIPGNSCPETYYELNQNGNQCVKQCPENYEISEQKCTEVKQDNDKSNVGLIVGIVVAVIVVVVVAIVVGVVCCKKNKGRDSKVQMRGDDVAEGRN